MIHRRVPMISNTVRRLVLLITATATLIGLAS